MDTLFVSLTGILIGYRICRRAMSLLPRVSIVITPAELTLRKTAGPYKAGESQVLPPFCPSKLDSTKVLNAVGGHSQKNRGPAMLQVDGYILKPFQGASSNSDSDPDSKKRRLRGEMEAQFYSFLRDSDHPLRRHSPRYFGIQSTQEGQKYLVLEDLTHKFQHPCVLDLKMGRRSYDEEATPEKVAKEKAKYPPQEVVGFRFSGMRVYQGATGGYIDSTRDWCLSLQPTQIPDALERFFFDGRSVRRTLVRHVVDQISEIAKCLEDHPTWRMYGASLLICYDAKFPDKTVTAKLIDFSHCYEIKDTGGKDYGFLHGLYFLLSSLNDILDRGRRNVTRRNSLVDTVSRRIVQGSERILEEHSDGSSAFQASSRNHVPPTHETSGAKTKNGLLPSLESDPHLGPVLRQLASDESERRRGCKRSNSMNDFYPTKAPASRTDSGRSQRYLSETPSASRRMPIRSDGLEQVREVSMDTLEVIPDGEPSTEYVVPRRTTSPLIPEQQQIGGAHENIRLQKDGTIIKEETDKDHFDTEVCFYRQIEGDSLAKVTPTLVAVDEQSHPRRLILEDATSLVTQTNPAALEQYYTSDDDGVASATGSNKEDIVNIMDIKLGFRSFRADAPNEPKSSYFEKYMRFVKEVAPHLVKQVWKKCVGSEEGPESLMTGLLGKRDYLSFRDGTTTSCECGFRLTALRHFNFEISQEEARKVDSVQAFRPFCENFLASGPNGFDSELAAGFIEELQGIQEAFEDSEIFHHYDFIGTSLLFVHQGGVPAIRWIDFANVSTPSSEDRNGVLNGIANLISDLENAIVRNQVMNTLRSQS